MSRLLKIYRTLRNNWKKTVFFTGLATYGAYWGNGKYVEFNMMRAYCEEATLYGQQKLPPLYPSRHVTIILNPVANKKKSKADYEKFCAPLFHLAGLKVSLVVTEAEGQAKDLMSIMENTDCVVIAGGDGTVHEVLTGLLRRNDASMAVKRFPLGIVPVGMNNSIAYKLNKNIFQETDTKAKVLGESTMSIIRGMLNDVDVMKIEGDQGRAVYSLGELNIGQIRNTITKLDQYWYLGARMKPYLTSFFQSFKNLSDTWNDAQAVKIAYTKPCAGCSKCYHRFEDASSLSSSSASSDSNQSSARWWHIFLPRNRPQTLATPDDKALMLERLKNVVNDDCDQWHTVMMNSKNILIRDEIAASEMQMIVHESDLTRSQFISECIRMSQNKEFTGKEAPPFKTIRAKDYHINIPRMESRMEIANHPIVSMPHDGAEMKEQVSTLEERQRSSDRKIKENVTGSFSLSKNDPKNFNPNSIRELEINIDESEAAHKASTPSAEPSPEPEPVNEPEPESEHDQWLSIDNENYEYQSTLRISLLPQKVQIYYSR